jgi:hypothetical protein
LVPHLDLMQKRQKIKRKNLSNKKEAVSKVRRPLFCNRLF